MYSENVTDAWAESLSVMCVNTICSRMQLSKTAHFHVVWMISPKKRGATHPTAASAGTTGPAWPRCWHFSAHGGPRTKSQGAFAAARGDQSAPSALVRRPRQTRLKEANRCGFRTWGIRREVRKFSRSAIRTQSLAKRLSARERTTDEGVSLFARATFRFETKCCRNVWICRSGSVSAPRLC